MKRQRHIIASVLLIITYLGACAFAQDSKENSEFKMAVNLYKDGLLDLAKEQLSTFIQKYPTTQQGIEARYYLGVTHIKLKNFVEAKNVLQNMAITYSDHPKAPDAWWSVGEAFAGMKNYKEAASAYERLRTFHPKHPLAPQALLEASNYYLLAGNYENSGIVLRAILQDYPNATEIMPARYALGKLYTRTNEFDRAFSELNRVADGSTNQELKAKAIVGLGVLHGMIGNKEEAEKKFREVITLYAKTPVMHEAHVRLGDLQRQYQNFSEASTSYNTVANNQEAPLAVREEAFIGAAECAAAASDYQGALRIYENFFLTMKGKEISANVFFGAAKAARNAKMYGAASQYYRQLLADTANALDRKLILKAAADNEHDAMNFNGELQYYQQYLASFPNESSIPFAWYSIGLIYEKEFKNYSRAIAAYNAILDRYSTSEVADDAQFARARSLFLSKKYEDAIEAYQQVMLQYPGSELTGEAVKDIEAIRMSVQQNPTEATERLARALAGLSANEPASVEVAIGEIYLYDLKDIPSAVKYFSQAQKKGVAGSDAERAAFGLVQIELMRLKRNEGSPLEVQRLLTEFVRNYASSAKRDEAAFQLFKLQSEGKAPSQIVLAANEFLAMNPKEHADEVALLLAEAKRESGKATEAETEYTRMIDSKKSIASEAQYGRAIARMNLGNYTGAVSDFQAYIASNPGGKNAPNANLNLAKLAERQGEYGKSASLYEEVGSRFSYSPQFKLAEIAMVKILSEGSYHERAISKATQFLEREKANPFSPDEIVSEYLFALAEAFAKKKEIVKAKFALQEYLTQYPKGKRIGEVYYALGQIFKDEGKIALATTYFQQAGISSGNNEASRDAADLLLESKRYDDAVREYRRLIEKTTLTQEKAYYESRIVVALFRANNTGEAQIAMNEFKKKYPDAEANFEEFELERGKNFHKQKKYTEALDVFEDIDDSKTEEIASLALLWIGKSYEGMNQNQKAEENFNSVIEKHQKTSAALEAYLSLGRMAFRAERWEEAAKNFKMVVEQTGIPPETMKEALNGIITCYDELNIADGAVEMTKRFITLYPGDPTIFRKRVNLGIFYQKLGYYDQAILHYENLLGEASSDDQAEIRYYIGECYFGKADYKQSIIEFLKVPYLVNKKIEIDWKATAYHSAGLAYEKLGQYDKAISMYELIKSSPDTDGTFKAAAEKDINRVKALLK